MICEIICTTNLYAHTIHKSIVGYQDGRTWWTNVHSETLVHKYRPPQSATQYQYREWPTSTMNTKDYCQHRCRIETLYIIQISMATMPNIINNGKWTLTKLFANNRAYWHHSYIGTHLRISETTSEFRKTTAKWTTTKLVVTTTKLTDITTKLTRMNNN